jgi:indole-3-acetate monooxygenase
VDTAFAGEGHLDGPGIWARVNQIDPVVREHTRQAEVDVCSQVEVIARLARADASAAWCAMIGVESGFFASYLDDSVARVLYPGLEMITAGFQGPAGTLVTENGEPRSTRSGRPEHRIALLPTEQWEVLETWDADGLAGSGSHDYTTEDAFVPEEHTFVPGQRRRPEPVCAWYGLSAAYGVGVAARHRNPSSGPAWRAPPR